MYFMGCDDKFHFGMTVEIVDEDLLVFWPWTSGDQGEISFWKLFDKGQFLSLAADLQNAVESGIACYRNFCYSYVFKELFRIFILNV